ncbi:low temperature requirement protein A [Rhodococcus aerolatus]
MPRFLRDRSPGHQQRATALELFYDLVFVFAVTQVSHHLLVHLTWTGVLQSAIMLVAVWWSWNYTTWVTNELDPESSVVRGLVVTLMLLSLLMAVAIPDAFGDRALLFAVPYVVLQVGRHLFLALVTADRGTPERERALRILVWFGAAGALWLAGALVDGPARTVLWVVAVVVDLAGPVSTYRVPGLPRLDPSRWDVVAEHFAERFQLFIIIALGESIVITGATTAELTLDPARSTAFVVAFLGSAAFWWLYFGDGAARAERRLAAAGTRSTQVARDAFTYLHVLLVAGIILAAVGDEIVIGHPGEHLHLPEASVVVAGPAVYLLGQTLFRWRTSGAVPVAPLVGGVACLAVLAVSTALPALVLALLLLAVVVVVVGAGARPAARRPRPTAA